VDLIPLRHWVRFENRHYGPALYGPTELRARLGHYQADADFLSDMRGESLAARPYAVGDCRVEAAPVTHIPDSWAFRVAPAGRSPGLVYSGDCANWRDLVPLIEQGDTLLCEAALGDDGDAGGPHLTIAEAQQAAAAGGATTLVLTQCLQPLDGRSPRAPRRAGVDRRHRLGSGREGHHSRPGRGVHSRRCRDRAWL
jgi:hypothetical protein